MIGEKWLDGPNRICEVVKEIQTGKSVKMAVLEVRDEFTNELMRSFFQHLYLYYKRTSFN